MFTKLCYKIAALLVLTLGLTGGLQAATVYTALLSGAAENPPNASAGSGLATLTYDALLQTLLVDVSFSGLTGTTTAAHIHCCVDSPGTAGVATPTPSFPGFPTGVTSGSYNQLFDLTQTSSFSSTFLTANGGTAAGAAAALLTGLDNAQAYFNIHTTCFTGGEIRGFFTPSPVPVPAAAWLFGSGLVGLLGIARRKELSHESC